MKRRRIMTTKKALQAQLAELEIEFPADATKTALEALVAGISVEDGEEETPKVSSSAVPEKYKKQYGKGQNCGDEMAAVFASTVKTEGKVDKKALYKVGDQNGIDVADRWGAGRKEGPLNLGMQRMNLGNVLRSRVKNGGFVTIGESSWGKEATEEAVA